PAAVAYLIDWGRAEQVAISLSARDARMIAVRVCGAFGLTRLLALLMGSTDAAEDELSLEGLRVNARLDGPRRAHEEDGTRTSSGDARFLEGSKVEAVEGPGDERPRLERRENGHGHPAPGSGARGQE